jgi:hypothetical protein
MVLWSIIQCSTIHLSDESHVYLFMLPFCTLVCFGFGVLVIRDDYTSIGFLKLSMVLRLISLP